MAGAIDPMADNSTWDLQEMGDSYVYTIPLAESGTTAPEIYTITSSLTNCTAVASNPSSIEENSTVTLYFTANSGYTLPTAISVTGASYDWDPTGGVLVISAPTGNVTLSIAATDDSANAGSNIPIYTFDGVRILSIYELWTHGGVHPAHIYNKGGLEIIFGKLEGASSLDYGLLDHFVLAGDEASLD